MMTKKNDFKFRDIYEGNFDRTHSEKATKALSFYEKHCDALDNSIYFEKLIDIEGQGFDMDLMRAYCAAGKSYSHSRFMQFIANWFGATVEEMKQCWRHI